ncbi:hypothetical protein SynA1560_00916 [Synechococcus sp. A15-60]|nr:hypothetical protein SynA1560_00916 [Synechococcus sp. A15-60]
MAHRLSIGSVNDDVIAVVRPGELLTGCLVCLFTANRQNSVDRQS